jgi:DNA repair ATPase RecN
MRRTIRAGARKGKRNDMKTAKAFAIAMAIPMIALAQPALAQDAETPITVTGKYLKQWEKAKAAEKAALAELADAQAKLTEANEEILEEDKDRQQRAEKAEKAEARLNELTAAVPQFVSAKDAKDWAGKVWEAADDWSDAVSNGKDDQKELRSAMKDQGKYQKRVDKAQAALNKARAQIAEAERRSQMAGTR